MQPYKYDYSDAREYCVSLGQVFLENWVPAIDTAFAAMKLNQTQVNRLMREYIMRVDHLFNPSNYTWKQRFLLALHFLKP